MLALHYVAFSFHRFLGTAAFTRAWNAPLPIFDEFALGSEFDLDEPTRWADQRGSSLGEVMPVEFEFICGYCGESSTILVDPSAGEEQSYVEDCQVCCRPNRVIVSVDPDTGEAQAQNFYEG